MATRATRLLKLLDLLRGRRRPVTARALSERLGVSLRTLYRDIAVLREQGAEIGGEPGSGYVLRQGYLLPALMFDADELEALVVGMQLAALQADDGLEVAARRALRRIAGHLPPELRVQIETAGLIVPSWDRPSSDAWVPALRQAIRCEHVVELAYRDASARASHRRIWPFALVFLQDCRLLVAWCELRQDFRSFRAERIVDAQDTGQRYPARRHQLLKRYRQREGYQAPDC